MSTSPAEADGTDCPIPPGIRTGVRVLVVGESLTDIIRTPSGTREHPGGSPANVALGLARLGITTTFLTALGRDPRGEAVARRLAAAGVRILPESWSLAATSTAVAEIQEDGAARYTFDLAWQLPAEIELPAAGHVHIGSVAAFLGPGAEQVEQIIRGLGTNATVSFDPNIRPDLLGEQAAVTGRFERLAALADVVKLSDEDAAFLYPGTEPGEAAHLISRLGPRVVAVTAGARGSLLVSGTATAHIGPIETTVADTVGAGDSYMAALLWKLLTAGRAKLQPASDTELAAAGTFAAEAAAVTVTRPGAEPPALEDLDCGAAAERSEGPMARDAASSGSPSGARLPGSAQTPSRRVTVTAADPIALQQQLDAAEAEAIEQAKFRGDCGILVTKVDHSTFTLELTPS